MSETVLVARSAVALVALTAAAVFAGCGGSNSSGGGSGSAKQAPAASGPIKAERGKLPMQMGEMFFRPKQVTAPKGKLRVTEHNGGQVAHEFILVRSSAAAGSLPAAGGDVDEKKLRIVGEIAHVAPGQSKSKTFDLKPGKYVYLCNLPGHYAGGMRGGLSVK
jgi:uncharacterized cupredoxin-like copper-binding protein